MIFLIIGIIFLSLDQSYLFLFKKKYPLMRDTVKNKTNYPLVSLVLLTYALYGYIIYEYIIDYSIQKTFKHMLMFYWLVWGTFNICNYYLLFDIWKPKHIFMDMVWGLLVTILCTFVARYIKFNKK